VSFIRIIFFEQLYRYNERDLESSRISAVEAKSSIFISCFQEVPALAVPVTDER